MDVSGVKTLRMRRDDTLDEAIEFLLFFIIAFEVVLLLSGIMMLA